MKFEPLYEADGTKQNQLFTLSSFFFSFSFPLLVDRTTKQPKSSALHCGVQLRDVPGHGGQPRQSILTVLTPECESNRDTETKTSIVSQ
ncbi:hypothetical protein Baya_10538 [Bagarius yarrelli]|uniref:Uncharacterized protein n=1 Tax=Bagarius yarrelli TaxID=175774 RepID=A0A556UFQ8_BAGYA|nr:hypothetical protein Baya_10538 [Bagarius yarrelli]